MGPRSAADGDRWQFEVHDTGPGFHAGPGAPIVEVLQPAGPERGDNGVARATAAEQEAKSDADPRPIEQAQGEGIGLAIVKRLCDLLDAAVEIESSAEHGTRVRVQLPRHYPPPAS